VKPKWTLRLNLNKTGIGKRLVAGFGIIILLMIAVTAVGGFHLFRSNQRLAEFVDGQYPRTVLLSTIKDDFTASVGNMRNIIAINDPQGVSKDLVLMEQSNAFIEENNVKLNTMLASTPAMTSDLQNLNARWATFKEAQNRFVALVKQGQLEPAKELMLTEITADVDVYIDAVNGLIERQRNGVETAGTKAAAAARRALTLMLGLTTLACTIGIVIAVLVIRSIIGPLKEAVGMAKRVAEGDLTSAIEVRSGDEIGHLMQSLHEMNASLGHIVGEARQNTDSIATASSEIAAGTAQLSIRTEQQAGSLRATANSVGELSMRVRKNAASAAEASEVGKAAASAAVKGGAVVTEVIATMELIRDSSRRIGDIIGVIDGIAFQTNILALNAAVEAARAGDHGRGFAVVAAEVRSLAQRSANAAKEIKDLIGDSVSKVDAGNVLVGHAGKAMDEIVGSVHKVAQIMLEITDASKAQSDDIESVSGALQQMDDITQQNAALVQQATAATESMKDQATALARSFEVFTLLDGDEAPQQPGLKKLRGLIDVDPATRVWRRTG
jgi:methyl-accepting chemotaxis protein